jgi:hypothetical protein
MPANRCELLATWYLRFNGYFTTPDFTIHPDYKKRPGSTDADVLAVRFPYSREDQRLFTFRRDPDLNCCDRVDFLICEVKAAMCNINPTTWRDPNRENVEYAIRWMGIENDHDRIKTIAQAVYQYGAWDPINEKTCIRFVCFGSELNPALKAELPRTHQVLHSHVIRFLKERFDTGSFQIQRQHWDKDIIDFAERCRRQNEHELLVWATQ